MPTPDPAKQLIPVREQFRAVCLKSKHIKKWVTEICCCLAWSESSRVCLLNLFNWITPMVFGSYFPHLLLQLSLGHAPWSHCHLSCEVNGCLVTTRPRLPLAAQACFIASFWARICLDFFLFPQEMTSSYCSSAADSLNSFHTLNITHWKSGFGAQKSHKLHTWKLKCVAYFNS